jgi:hypothetical protein
VNQELDIRRAGRSGPPEGEPDGCFVPSTLQSPRGIFPPRANDFRTERR